jgi:hypothetical protein
MPPTAAWHASKSPLFRKSDLPSPGREQARVRYRSSQTSSKRQLL